MRTTAPIHCTGDNVSLKMKYASETVTRSSASPKMDVWMPPISFTPAKSVRRDRKVTTVKQMMGRIAASGRMVYGPEKIKKAGTVTTVIAKSV